MHYEIYGYSTVEVKPIKDGNDIYFNKRTYLCRLDYENFTGIKPRKMIKPKPYIYNNLAEIRAVQRRFKKVWKVGLLIHHKKITNA